MLIQFPPALTFHVDKTGGIYKLCKKSYPYYKFAMEVRHNSWLDKESIALMKKYNIAFVISQSGVGFSYAELVTAAHIYVRFHGPHELYASSYNDEELLRFAKLFKEWEKNGHSVWAFFNNDIHGYAFENARKLKNFCDA